MPLLCNTPNTPPLSQQTHFDIIGLTRSELDSALRTAPIAEEHAKVPMRVKQIWQWVYQKGVSDFAMMSNLSKEYRAHLANHFTITRPQVIQRALSRDGTRKYLVRLGDGHNVETVYIPEATRGTLCLSTQVGCTLTCPFCHTGTQRRIRNLTAQEIVAQVLLVRDDLGEWPQAQRAPKNETRLLSNVVLMGMGEPLYNFDNVRTALHIIMDNEGISLSRRRITLSTSGVVPYIERTAREIGCMLAVSLHATTDQVRDQLVPINRKWNIATLMRALRAYPTLSNAERITFEYVMLDGVNDHLSDAKRLVQLLSGIPAKVNLIPFNAWPGAPYRCSAPDRIQRFADVVYQAGYAAPVRTPRGQDIMAACGQLKSAALQKV